MQVQEPTELPRVLVIGAGTLAIDIVACRLGFGPDIVEWVTPEVSVTAARKLVAGSSLVSDVHGTLDRLVVTSSVTLQTKRCKELWLVHSEVETITVAEWLRLAAPAELNLICGIGGKMIGDEVAALCADTQTALRIFSTGWPLGENSLFPGVESNPAERFLTELHEFKLEIQERIPGYFDFYALRFLSPQGNGPYLASAEETARVLVEAVREPLTRNGRYSIAGSSQRTFWEFCEQAGDVFGISLLAVKEQTLLNPVDEIFHQRICSITQMIVSSDVTSSYIPLPRQSIHFDYNAQMAAMTNLRQNLDRLCDNRNKRCSSLFLNLEIRSVEEYPDLTYFQFGKGDIPIVLINALGQSLVYWSRLFDILCRNHCVLIWEPRGISSTTDFCLGDHVADLERILGREAISRCHLVGWCTGPKVAMEFYRRRPDMIESMVFLNPSLKGPGLSKDLDTAYESNLEPLFQMLSQRPDMTAFVRNALESSLSLETEEDESNFPTAAVSAMNVDLKQHVLQPFHSELSTISYARQLLDFWSQDAATFAADIRVPVLLLTAEFDQIASPAMAQAVRDLIPETEYVEIPGATHYCLYDRPTLVSDLMETFFRRTVARTTTATKLKHSQPQPQDCERVIAEELSTRGFHEQT
jgi:pimeloyl-ACP methyl ester carboxylesterase